MFIQIYSIAITIAVLCLFWLFLNLKKSLKKEISTQRINILEDDGSLKMVISNSKKQHTGIINGKPLPERERPAGIIFFNSAGDECGGLIYDNDKEGAGLVLSIDKFRDDQIMQLQYNEDFAKKASKYGFQVWNYPAESSYEKRQIEVEKLHKLKSTEERKQAIENIKSMKLLPEDRVFLGKTIENEFGLFINDSEGKARIKIYVGKNNEAKIEVVE